ncbi:hypothetical protein JCM1393_06490 [Clostridium carnis]
MKKKLIFMIMTIWGVTLIGGNIPVQAKEGELIYSQYSRSGSHYKARSRFIIKAGNDYGEMNLIGASDGLCWISSPAESIYDQFVYADMYAQTSRRVNIKKVTYSTQGDIIDLQKEYLRILDEKERYMNNVTYNPENVELIAFNRIEDGKPVGEIVFDINPTIVDKENKVREITFDLDNNNESYRYIGIRVNKNESPVGLMKIDNLLFYVKGEKPVIEADNKVININDNFDKMVGVKAIDKEDGDITKKVEVTGEVNTKEAGKYNLTYKVLDEDLNEVSKTIEVVVKEAAKEVVPEPKVAIPVEPEANHKEVVKEEEVVKPNVVVPPVAVVPNEVKPPVVKPDVVKPSNEKPVINVENKSIKAYENFDKMAGVKATDKEDGDITKKVTVIGDVNTKVAGKYNLIYEVTDKDGNKVSKAIEVIVHKLPITLERSIGKDRYDTATKLSQIEFNKSNTVVIVNGSAIVDGLTATPLATYLKAPVLLADKNTVPDETINEIKRLGATKAIIAGGAGVISENVVNKLKSLGINTVERVAGKDRYSTSLEIAKYIDRNFYDVSNVIVSSGVGEADALSIASVAGRDKMPIILVEKDMIPSEVYNWMKNEDLQNAYIIGGTGIVNNTVLNLVNGITKNNISENRLGGKDRYETNAKVISKFYSNSLDKVYVAKALELVDALTAGPVAAVGQAPVVLANGNLTEAQRNTLASKKANKVIQAGGGVSEEAVNSLKAILN